MALALHRAAKSGKPELLEKLIARGEKVNAVDGAKWTPLHVAAAEGIVPSVRVLLDHGAKVNMKTANQRTALHLGVLRNNDELVRILLDAGSDPTVVNDDGRDAAAVAELFEFESLVPILTEARVEYLAKKERGEILEEEPEEEPIAKKPPVEEEKVEESKAPVKSVEEPSSKPSEEQTAEDFEVCLKFRGAIMKRRFSVNMKIEDVKWWALTKTGVWPQRQKLLGFEGNGPSDGTSLRDVIPTWPKKPLTLVGTPEEEIELASKEEREIRELQLKSGLTVKRKADAQNGATMNYFKWTQTVREVVVQVPVPPGTSGKSIKCVISPTSIKINIPDTRWNFEKNLCKRVKVEKSFWQLENARTLWVHVEKVEQVYWEYVLEGDQPLDVSDCQATETTLDDMDDECREKTMNLFRRHLG